MQIQYCQMKENEVQKENDIGLVLQGGKGVTLDNFQMEKLAHSLCYAERLSTARLSINVYGNIYLEKIFVRQGPD